MRTPKEKTQPGLGIEVQRMLVERGLETPMATPINTPGLDETGKLIAVSNNVRQTMLALGLDLENDSLCDTPNRVAKMLVNELFWGLDYSNFPKATTIANSMHLDEMIVERNVRVSSMCEHHLMPICGFAHVAYIPEQRVLGLSKLNRIVDFFSRRPQVQERLTLQISNTLQHVLKTPNVAVFIEAEHLCVQHRGVEDGCSDTATSSLGGVFKRPEVRAEFFSIIRGAAKA